MKLLSVAVPAYNMEAYLAECLDSLSDARLCDVEVLIIDDGSIDTTAEIAREFVSRDPARFSLIQKENGGHGSAVNAGIAHAKGKYFRVVDADDMMFAAGLLEVLEILRHSDADMIIDERVRFREGMSDMRDTLPEGAKGISEGTLPYVNMHTISARLDFIRGIELCLLEKTFYVDFQYAFELIAHAKSIQFVRALVYRYRLGNAGQSVYYLNYVKRYADHDRMLMACAQSASGAIAERMLRDAAHTQYKIALIFNPDVHQGRAQARALRRALKETCPAVERAARRRFYMLLLLNRSGLRQLILSKLRGYAS